MKEDFLLKQIDEFREKAKQLQSLISSKEDKVQDDGGDENDFAIPCQRNRRAAFNRTSYK